MDGMTVLRKLVAIFSIGWYLLAAGCASPDRQSLGGPLVFPALDAGGEIEAAPDVDVLALSEPMRRLLARQVMIYPDRSARLQALRRLFSDTSPLPLKYDRSQSRTAAETFAGGAGDCVSFSNLVVAMARQVGLDARYRDVLVRSNWERSGDLAVFRRHMNVAVGDGRRFEVYDFFAAGDPDARGEFISDARARAQYFNNRGMEYFRAGQAETALRYLKRALLIDPGLAFIWSNVGTVYSQRGNYAAAERFLQRALAVEPGNGSALANLSELYRKQGRNAQADEYAHRAEPYRRHNPYYLYDLAAAAYARGRFWVALEELQQALAIKADVSFYELRARIYLTLGETGPARQSCRSAVALARRSALPAPSLCREPETASSRP